MHRLIKLVLALLFATILCTNVPAQEKEDFRSGAIKTSCGYMLVWNAPGNYYTLQVSGKDVRQTSTEQIQFNVDGIFLQVVTPTVKSFLKDAQNLDAKAILAAHRDWEANYLEGEYGEKLKVESFPQKLANGQEALLWQFALPASAGGNVLKQTYLAVLKGDHVVMFGSIVTKEITEKASHRLLLLTAMGLRASENPTDLSKMQALLKVD